MNHCSVYINNHVHKALTSLNNYLDTNSEEDLHALRVHLKKIRSILFFLRQQSRHDRKEISKRYRQLKRFFRQAGIVREAGLRLNWLKEAGLSPLADASDSYHRLQQAQRKLIHNAQEHRWVLQQLNKDQQLVGKNGQPPAVQQYIVQLKDTLFLIALSGSRDEWHELRKTIKRILYATQWLKPDAAHAMISKKLLEKLDQLQEQIGYWNDLVGYQEWMVRQDFLNSKNPELKQLASKAFKRLNDKLQVHARKVDVLLQQVITAL